MTYSIADRSAKTKEESHDETLDGPCDGVAGHAACTFSLRPRSLAPTFFSGSTSTPPTPAGKAAKHDAHSRRRGRECRARCGPVDSQSDEGLPDRRGPKGRNWTAANLTNADLSQANLTNADFSYYGDDYSLYDTDLTGANLQPGQPHKCELLWRR